MRSSRRRHNTGSSKPKNGSSFRDVFRRLTKKNPQEMDISATEFSDSSIDVDECLNNIRAPILTPASSFEINDSSSLPTIPTDQVVLPGSELQQAMAEAMAENMQTEEDECVICMEGFDPTNPRAPTLCGCGANNVHFHLPCLFQWLGKSPKCPTCDINLISLDDL